MRSSPGSADDDGGYEWIEPVSSPGLDTDHQLPFDDFLTDVEHSAVAIVGPG